MFKPNEVHNTYLTRVRCVLEEMSYHMNFTPKGVGNEYVYLHVPTQTLVGRLK